MNWSLVITVGHVDFIIYILIAHIYSIAWLIYSLIGLAAFCCMPTTLSSGVALTQVRLPTRLY